MKGINYFILGNGVFPLNVTLKFVPNCENLCDLCLIKMKSELKDIVSPSVRDLTCDSLDVCIYTTVVEGAVQYRYRFFFSSLMDCQRAKPAKTCYFKN